MRVTLKMKQAIKRAYRLNRLPSKDEVFAEIQSIENHWFTLEDGHGGHYDLDDLSRHVMSCLKSAGYKFNH